MSIPYIYIYIYLYFLKIYIYEIIFSPTFVQLQLYFSAFLFVCVSFNLYSPHEKQL